MVTAVKLSEYLVASNGEFATFSKFACSDDDEVFQ